MRSAVDGRAGGRVWRIPGALCLGLLAAAGPLLSPAPARAAATGPILDPDNGHYYETVAVDAGIAWYKADDAARARTYQGMHGHLATIPSPAVNQFIAQNFPQAVDGYYCLGGVQSHGLLDPAAGWRWETGAPMSYTNWNRLDGTEPDDYYGAGTSSQDENRLQFVGGTDGQWNDIRPTSVESGGYVVEYEPAPPATPPLVTGYSVDTPGNAAPNNAPPGTLIRITGMNLGTEGTVLFDSDPLPAAVASWTPVEIRVWAPTAPSYPFQTHVDLYTNRQFAAGGDFTITAPTPRKDNLLANGSFEYPDSSGSPELLGYTYGLPLQPDYDAYNGYTIPGWRIPFGTIDVVRDGWQPAPGQGKQSLGLVGHPGAGTIEQAFFTVPGKTYIVRGWFAHNPGVTDARMIVWLSHGFNTEQLAQWYDSHGSTTPDNMGWTQLSWEFKASAAQTTITFQDVTGLNDYQGEALDGLIVTPAN